jgi:hypothetical protein
MRRFIFHALHCVHTLEAARTVLFPDSTCDASVLLTDHISHHQGYIYSVFNLVYVSNIASCRLWDSLGFDRIGTSPPNPSFTRRPLCPLAASPLRRFNHLPFTRHRPAGKCSKVEFKLNPPTGRVPGCGLLKGHDDLVDAIQYGRHLVPKEEVVRRMAERNKEGKGEGGEKVEGAVPGVLGKTEVGEEVLL